MAKADLRDDGRQACPATGPLPYFVHRGPASPIPVVRTLPDGTTAAALLREIERLYPQRADPAITVQIAALSRRYIALDGWTSVSPPIPHGRAPGVTGRSL